MQFATINCGHNYSVHREINLYSVLLQTITRNVSSVVPQHTVTSCLPGLIIRVDKTIWGKFAYLFL